MVVSHATQEDDKYLVLSFEDQELNDNRATLRDCGIVSGNTLVLRDTGGITFKLLSREHLRRTKIKEQEDARKKGEGGGLQTEAEEHAED